MWTPSLFKGNFQRIIQKVDAQQFPFMSFTHRILYIGIEIGNTMAPLYFDYFADNPKLALSEEPIQSHQDPLNKHVVWPELRYF